MLGMDFTSLCYLSIRVHIIASFRRKINPHFEFFSQCDGNPPAFPKAAEKGGLSSPNFCTKIFPW